MKPEDALQCAIWTYAQQVLPPEADFASIETKVGLDAARQGAMRKARGIQAGETDCRTIWQGWTRYHELKVDASVSDAQKRRHAKLRQAGAWVDIVKSVQQMHDVWINMAIPLRHHSLTPAMRDEMLAARVAAKPGKTRQNPVERTTRRVSKRALRFAAKAQQR